MRVVLAALAATSMLAAPIAVAAQSSNSGQKSAQSTPAKSQVKKRLSEQVLDSKRTAKKLMAQIMLDRAGYSPGVIDGYGGGNTTNAVEAYQRANGMKADGVVNSALLKKLRDKDSGKFMRVVQLKSKDVNESYAKVPEGMEAMSKMKHVGYESISEMLAERYHMDQDFLKALNPDYDWAAAKAGDSIIVVNPGPAKLDKTVDRIIVDKPNNQVEAYAGDELLATYPATIGSGDLPSPSGTMDVAAVAPEANYTFNPETNNWGGDKALTIAAGPNNPVGGVWIDLSKPTYGIHGSPDPALIGKTQSHGCVRLTNWDARELADAVKAGAKVEFKG